ncbi:SgcJ/EcaC family oxidoreductase [Enterobacter cloacae complex sp. ECC445]|uniref:SgcJ/EcaC family oxidoreductase n=1 Tax=Enterobacter TaxID=547 RepID=UPI00062C1A50|nr:MULTISPECIES: SgcJ/EcaC family oxidoreductase [Enterobacter]KKY78439.1 signal peptide protein [Enterobacter cloacae]MCG0456731.1 SgcJ/EcaC family oxidoreductase [Enterobacter cloacae complex sp. ECC445]MCK7114402.1 SgcJ/EcaC family oxidoreductase [Enterobacter kobei]MDE7592127.1 SgcJ/EcaC family oxidoreductase [Enterobacter bugandensis]
MKKMIGIIGSLMLISGTAGAATSTATCVKTDNAAIEALFDRWNASLKTGDPQKVAENYLSDAVLLPTVSNQVRLTDAEREDYFKHFLEKNPVGHIDSRTIRIGCNKAIDTGTYTFTFADNSKVSARYTFTYAWTGDEWKISSHHSSAMPES